MAGLGSCGGLVMGVREIDRFLEQWQIGVKDLRRRMILAPTPRERWYAIWLLAQGWTATAEVFHGEQGVGEEESSERRGSPGTGALLLAGESGLSHNSALILSK